MGDVINSSSLGISVLDKSSDYSKLLSEFPEVTGQAPVQNSGLHNVSHYIVTNGPPVAERARRLTSEKLQAAKKEFVQFMEQGICRPSSSPWASPIHLANKEENLDFVGITVVSTQSRCPTDT